VFECDILELDERKLVGISYTGPYSAYPQEAIQVQLRFEKRLEELAINRENYTLWSPFFGNRFLATYFACVEQKDKELVPEGMVSFILPASRYARIRCNNQTVGEAHQQLHQWIQEHELQVDHQACSIEVFYIGQGEKEEPVDILQPLKKL
jgi:predicted transcriptional regulator YdeE